MQDHCFHINLFKNLKLVFIIILLSSIFSIFIYSQKLNQIDYSKKIEESTPKLPPQIPVVERLTTDAEDDGLKGKVKSVVLEREGLTGIEKPIGRRLDLIADFNEQGNYIKQIYFEYRGKPYNVLVYGYIDKSRVSTSGYVDLGDRLQVRSVDDKSKPEEKSVPDSRYENKYDYKYKDGKLVEMQIFNNAGSKGMRYEYKYKSSQKEIIGYTSTGELNSHYLYRFDKNGNEIGRVDFDVRLPKPVEKNKYKFTNESFDEKGNWTKRIFSKLEIVDGKETLIPIANEYRKITYYP